MAPDKDAGQVLLVGVQRDPDGRVRVDAGRGHVGAESTQTVDDVAQRVADRQLEAGLALVRSEMKTFRSIASRVIGPGVQY